MMDTGTATLAMAASITDRSHDLIQDGWVKGEFYTGIGGVEGFCILGALDLAIEELLGTTLGGNTLARNEIRDVAVAFILDEAREQFDYRGESIPTFNDASERKLEHILGVLSRAASRLWDLSVGSEDIGVAWSPSPAFLSAAGTTEAQHFLTKVLA